MQEVGREGRRNVGLAVPDGSHCSGYLTGFGRLGEVPARSGTQRVDDGVAFALGGHDEHLHSSPKKVLDRFDQAAFGCKSAAGKHATETFDLEVRPTHEEIRGDAPGTGDRLAHLEDGVMQQPVLVDSFNLGGVALRCMNRVGSGRVELPGLGPAGPARD